MITASIVLYNTKKEELNTLLGCVDDSNIDVVFVVDNSQTDILRDQVLSSSKKAEYIFGHGNVGYGKAHNIALNKAIGLNAEYHVILNPDIFIDKGTIDSLSAFMDKHLDVGLCMPDIIYPDGTEQYLCKLLPTPLDMFGRRLLPASWMEQRNNRFEMRSTGYCKTRNVPLLSGCFMFLRLSVIKQVGLFDDRFFMYFEDYDLIRRIHHVKKTVFYPSVKVVHNHAREHRSNKKLLIVSIKSAISYFNKWGWFFDKERRVVNRNAFSDENIIND